MIWIYRILFLPAFFMLMPYYALRMMRRGGYRKDFSHRLGLIPKLKSAKNTKRIWIQAVSVGEAKAIGPLVNMFQQLPNVEIIITTTTSTAYTIIQEQYASKVALVGIFPIDFWPFSKFAWHQLQPDLAILMESELWPEHLHQAKRRKVPVILINARMSDRSFRRYHIVRGTAQWLLSGPTKILASARADAERFIHLGAPPDRVIATGSIKFDVQIEPILNDAEIDAMKQEMGLLSAFSENRSHTANPPLTLLGSSTWPGEEKMLLNILESALQAGINCRLLLVPRHAERRDEIIALLEKQSRRWQVRSRGPARSSVRIYLADTTGELGTLSQLANLAFIGKSMPPNDGGQSPIEAAAIGLPIIYGPNMSNFRPIARSLEEAGAASVVHNAAHAQQTIVELLKKSKARQKMSKAAKNWHTRNRGATERTFQECITFLQ